MGASMSLTKVELTELAYENLKIDKKEAERLVELFFEEMKEAIARQGEMLFSGFGRFIAKEKKERRGRNPQTGGEMQITARKVVSFQHSLVLKGRLNGGKG
jgi:integration host factor subunit alpha